MRRRAVSRGRRCVVLLSVVLLALTSSVLNLNRPEPMSAPWFGALEAGPDQDAALRTAGVDTITVSLGWDAYEPAPGRTDDRYAKRQRLRVEQLHREGFQVILDLGLQYPPSWAFSLPGASRLRDQLGNAWSGGPGSNLVNAMFSPAVRKAQAGYVAQVSHDLRSAGVNAVRIGGLNMGELSYPPSSPGHRSLWMYDKAAQDRSPVPGWRPGAGTKDDAAAALKFYFDSLNTYEEFLLGAVAHDFPDADLQLLLPSWGLRPGQVRDAVQDGLRGRTSGELNDAVAQALDWPAQLKILSRFRGRGTAYTTWIDAHSQGASMQLRSPVDYLATLSRPLHLKLAGENTGGTSTSAMALSLHRRKALGLVGIQWMTASNLLSSQALVDSYSTASRKAS